MIWLKRLWASLFVPKGLYCYKPVGVKYGKDGRPRMLVKPCRYYELGMCRLILPKMDGWMMWDKIKVCGINEKIDEKNTEEEKV